MQKILILGRGRIPLLVAVFAEKRGYQPIVVYEDGSSRFPAIIGGLPGLPLNHFFDCVGFPLEDPRFFRAISPALLFFGENWQLLGVPELRSGFSEQERDRWMPGFVSLQEILLPEIFGVLKKEFALSTVSRNFFQRWLSGWQYRRFDRKEERAARKVLQRIPEVKVWNEFLQSISPYLGLSSLEESGPLLRALVSCLNGWMSIPEPEILHREVQKTALKALKNSIREWDGMPIVPELDRKKRTLSISLNGKTEIVDRMIDLSGILDRTLDLSSWEWTIPEDRLSNGWPLQFLIPDSLGEGTSGIFQGLSREGQIRFSVILHGTDGKMQSITPRELLDPLVLGEGNIPGLPCLIPEPRRMVDYGGLPAGHSWRIRSSYQMISGPIHRFLDPTRLPYLTEDWMRLLYRQLPLP